MSVSKINKEKNTMEVSKNEKAKDTQGVTEVTPLTKEEIEQKVEQERIEDLVTIAKDKGLDKAMKEMSERIGREEQIVEMEYTIKCFQHEGAYAISQAVERVLGRFDMAPSGASEGPPTLINIKLPNGEYVKAPWGEISLPGFDKGCYIELDYDWDRGELTVEARIKTRDEADIRKIITMAEQILAKESIYLGQAIELNFDSSGYADEPTFMDLSAIDSDKILFSDEILDGLVPVLSRIKETERCREEGLDIKLGVLMEGPYGTGKTLTAFWLGKIATQHNWTFIYLKNCKNAAKALKMSENFARNGNGVVLFTEDIDQVIRGKRDQTIQDIVNTLDGGDTKTLPIISMFTTNHIEVIEPTFLRGKRIGSLIHFGDLDLATAKQFIDKLVVDANNISLMEEGDHTEAYEALSGIVPAFASEVIDKAKAYMINRGSRKISVADIVTAANSYKKQIAFAECTLLDKDGDSLESALKIIGRQLIGVATNSSRQGILNKLGEIYKDIQDVD